MSWPQGRIVLGFHSDLWNLVEENRETFCAASVYPEYLPPEKIDSGITNPVILPFPMNGSSDLFKLAVTSIAQPVVAAVEDTTGHPAHQAISAGATCAVNMLLAPALWLDPMLSILRSRTSPHAVAEGNSLAELLCGDWTVSQIAKIMCCSERSAYRRIRELYQATNVRNRSEFKSYTFSQCTRRDE